MTPIPPHASRLQPLNSIDPIDLTRIRTRADALVSGGEAISEPSLLWDTCRFLFFTSCAYVYIRRRIYLPTWADDNLQRESKRSPHQLQQWPVRNQKFQS